jgi:GT2 family glycosyltransferase
MAQTEALNGANTQVRPYVCEKAEVGVIFVDYRSDPQLIHALRALAEDRSGISLRIVVVQNSPISPPPDLPDGIAVEWIQSEKNLGFGPAVNLARAGLQTPYLWILNPDVLPTPDTLGVLHAYLRRHPDVGLVAPKLLDLDGRLQYSVRRYYDLPTLLLRRGPLGRFFPNASRLRRHLMSDWDHSDIREVDWALGACLLLRATAVPAEVFDPQFFLYFEDVDLCLTLQTAGWKTVYHPEAVARHLHRQTSRRHFFNRATWEHFKSSLRFALKHRGFSPRHAPPTD